jgi:hypothetical protein
MQPRSRTYLLVMSKEEPRGRRFVRLPAPSVLVWFQRTWTVAEDLAALDERLGGRVQGLDDFFEAVAAARLPVPADDAELARAIEAHLPVERDLEVEDHFLHVVTDDDEIEIAYWLFDDAFLASPGALDRLPAAGRRQDRYARLLDSVNARSSE